MPAGARTVRLDSMRACIVLAALLTLTACGGVTLDAPQAGALGPTGAVAAPQVATASGDDKPAPFDPFNERADTAAPLREVIKDPSLAEVMKSGPLSEMAMGRADAPVTIIKYMSLTCPFCRQFHQTVFPELKRQYIDTGKVRFILREFPIGFQSGMATIALRCVTADKYFDLYGRYLTQQAKWVSQDVRKEPIYEVAKGVGLTREAFDACTGNRALIDGLKWVKDRGRTLGIIGTPNFFVNGKLVKKVLSLAEIKAMVDPILAGRAAGAGSDAIPLQ